MARDAADDYVIQGMPFARALQLDPLDTCAWEASRIGLREHGQQVMRSDLALE